MMVRVRPGNNRKSAMARGTATESGQRKAVARGRRPHWRGWPPQPCAMVVIACPQPLACHNDAGVVHTMPWHDRANLRVALRLLYLRQAQAQPGAQGGRRLEGGQIRRKVSDSVLRFMTNSQAPGFPQPVQGPQHPSESVADRSAAPYPVMYTPRKHVCPSSILPGCWSTTRSSTCGSSWQRRGATRPGLALITETTTVSVE